MGWVERTMDAILPSGNDRGEQVAGHALTLSVDSKALAVTNDSVQNSNSKTAATITAYVALGLKMDDPVIVRLLKNDDDTTSTIKEFQKKRILEYKEPTYNGLF